MSAMKLRRSRAGCRECRRLHHKCDETHPACLNCRAAGKACSYNKTLSWGGRPFSKSPFGQALAAGVIPVTDGTVNEGGTVSSLVYAMPPAKLRRRKPSPKTTSTTSPIALAPIIGSMFADESSQIEETGDPPALESVLLNPDPLSWLSKTHRSLLHYFAETVAPCFSLHQIHHQNFCTNLIPMAVDTNYGSHVLSAVLLTAAQHQSSLKHTTGDVVRAKLLQNSLHHLRKQNLGYNTEVDDLFVAASLILCLVDIMSGGHEQNSWRIHLKGALALLNSTKPFHSSESLTPTRRFLQRWCNSFQILSLSSPQHVLGSIAEGTGSCSESREIDGPDYIDLFDGFSKTLLPVFEEIYDLCVEGSAISDLQKCTSDQNNIDLLLGLRSQRCRRLEMRIKAMIANPTTTLDPLLPASGNNNVRADFVLLNVAYHYTALLELYQRVLDKPSSDVDTQDAVKKGIETLKTMKFRDGPCPAVATLHPVFTIGCSAHAIEDRAFILEWLSQLKSRYAMGNVHSATTFLLGLWQQNDVLEAKQSHLQWDTSMIQKGLDLSLY